MHLSHSSRQSESDSVSSDNFSRVEECAKIQFSLTHYTILYFSNGGQADVLNVEYVVISSPRARDCQCCVAAHGLWCPGVECSDSATSRQLSRLLSHCQHLLSCVSSKVIVNNSSVVNPLQSMSTPPQLCILL